MNGEELKMLRDGFMASNGKLDALATQVGALATEVAGTTGRLEQASNQHDKHISVLFSQLKEANERLRQVEADYVPEGEHDTDMEKNQQAHKEFRLGLEKQSTFGGKLTGGAIVLALVAGALITWLLETFGGKEQG